MIVVRNVFQWHNWYARSTPLCEGGHREIFSAAKQL
jgi:hypothetical protein